MYYLHSIALLLATLVIASSQSRPTTGECLTVPNYDTKAFTYYICNVANNNAYRRSREFCTSSYEEGDLVTFPNREEYQFLVDTTKKISDPSFRYFIGFYQESDEDRYNPETGRYYWVTDEKNPITSNSATYWAPFERYIVNFQTLPLNLKYFTYFLLDRSGTLYPGVKFNGESYNDPNSRVYTVCMKPGVSEQDATGTTLKPWVAIVSGLGGFLLLAVVLAVITGCWIKKREKDKHKQGSMDNRGLEETEACLDEPTVNLRPTAV